MSKHTQPKPWTDINPIDGRPRAQCRACYESGLRWNHSVVTCTECQRRTQNRREAGNAQA